MRMIRIVCACEDLTQDFMLQFIVLVLYRELVGLIAEGIDTNAVNCIKESVHICFGCNVMNKRPINLVRLHKSNRPYTPILTKQHQGCVAQSIL